MGDRLAEFIRALEAASGRAPWPDDLPADLRDQAARLVASGGRLAREPEVPKRFAGKALRVFRKAGEAARGRSSLRLVFDSWLAPAPAVRRAAGAETRFLRYDGPVRIELQTRATGRGVELLGQIDPPDAAKEVVLVSDGKERRAAVDSVGSFRIARVPRGSGRMRIGGTTIEDVPL